MASRSSLPSRFPVGTKLVIEGRPRGEGQVQVSKRYVEFPDGTFIRLPLHPPSPIASAPGAETRSPSAERSAAGSVSGPAVATCRGQSAIGLAVSSMVASLRDSQAENPGSGGRG